MQKLIEEHTLMIVNAKANGSTYLGRNKKKQRIIVLSILPPQYPYFVLILHHNKKCHQLGSDRQSKWINGLMEGRIKEHAFSM